MSHNGFAELVDSAITQGMKHDIEVVLASNCLAATVVLILCGMDAMAYLSMAPEKTTASRADFISWAEHYIRFPCEEQLTGCDLYGARCAMVHVYGAESDLSREGKCRLVGYMDKSIPEVRYNPRLRADFVLVSVPALKEAFFRGVDAFLGATLQDEAKTRIVCSRLRNLVRRFPVPSHLL